MSILIGSSGFVGGHLGLDHEFKFSFNRLNIKELTNMKTDLLVCAGLPAQKWKANLSPEADWNNMLELARILTTVDANKAALISTIDVFQPALNVNEFTHPNLNGNQAYGRNRAWFETFFKSTFKNYHIIRLPALFANNLRKNLIYDLMNKNVTELSKVNKNSTFQFFDITQIWNIINICIEQDFNILNVSSEPQVAQEIADIFGFQLSANSEVVNYDMKSIFSEKLGGHDGYIYDKMTIIDGIKALVKKCDS
jgi:hypothetical protein